MILSIVVCLVVLTLALWAVSLIPFPANAGLLRNVLSILLIVLAILWIVGGSGLWVGSPVLRR